jgi:anti-sigma factor RsiW
VEPAQHRGLRESLGAYLLGALPDADCVVVGDHVDRCAACSAELAALSPIVGLLIELDTDHA